MFPGEIVSEIDSTLEQLIKNAETLTSSSTADLSENVIDAFKKTQESLIHHLMYMDQLLESKRSGLKIQNKRTVSYKIQEKSERFEKLKNVVEKTLRQATRKSEILTKRRGKRLIYTEIT